MDEDRRLIEHIKRDLIAYGVFAVKAIKKNGRITGFKRIDPRKVTIESGKKK